MNTTTAQPAVGTTPTLTAHTLVNCSVIVGSTTHAVGNTMPYLATTAVRAASALLARPVDLRSRLQAGLIGDESYEHLSQNHPGFMRDHADAAKLAPRKFTAAAQQLLDMAHLCREARWARTTPPRLGDTFFITGGGWGYLNKSVMADLRHAAMVVDGWKSPSAEQLLEAWRVTLALSLHYPSVPPQREADLAAAGFATSEVLLTSAAGVACKIADTMLQATRQSHPLHGVAQEARQMAQEAIRVIYDGVEYTLT